MTLEEWVLDPDTLPKFLSRLALVVIVGLGACFGFVALLVWLWRWNWTVTLGLLAVGFYRWAKWAIR